MIIVDAQRGFLEGPTAIPDAARLVDRLSTLLSRARLAGALVVHLQNDGAPGATDHAGTAGWELCLPVVESGSEVVVHKSTDDGFAGTRLQEILDGRGVRRVVIGGLLSEMCVSATARAALARGLEVVIPRDAHGTYDLDQITAGVVARVAEHALGDQPELVDSTDVSFVAPPGTVHINRDGDVSPTTAPADGALMRSTHRPSPRSAAAAAAAGCGAAAHGSPG